VLSLKMLLPEHSPTPFQKAEGHYQQDEQNTIRIYKEFRRKAHRELLAYFFKKLQLFLANISILAHSIQYFLFDSSVRGS